MNDAKSTITLLACFIVLTTVPSASADFVGIRSVTPDSACLDADDDGTIGAADLAMLLGNWGPCP